jgi:hypothetical protein
VDGFIAEVGNPNAAETNEEPVLEKAQDTNLHTTGQLPVIDACLDSTVHPHLLADRDSLPLDIATAEHSEAPSASGTPRHQRKNLSVFSTPPASLAPPAFPDPPVTTRSKPRPKPRPGYLSALEERAAA